MPLTWHNLATGGAGEWTNASSTSVSHSIVAASRESAGATSRWSTVFASTSSQSGSIGERAGSTYLGSSFSSTRTTGMITGSTWSYQATSTTYASGLDQVSLQAESQLQQQGASTQDVGGVGEVFSFAGSSFSRTVSFSSSSTAGASISWTRSTGVSWGTTTGQTATFRTGDGTDSGVTVTSSSTTSGSTTSTVSTGTSAFSPPVSTATTSWASTTTTGSRALETTTTHTESATRITAAQVTTSAGTVTGSYWTTTTTAVTATVTTASTVSAAATTRTAQTTTYDPRSFHVDTVVSRTAPGEWLFFYTALAASGALTQLATAFDITTSAARADTTGSLTLRVVTDTSTATRTTTGYALGTSTITGSTLSTVSSARAQWSGAFPMPTASGAHTLITSTTATVLAPVSTSGTVSFAPAGNYSASTTTIGYSPITTRVAFMHGASGGSSTFAEHVEVASTYTRESYVVIPGNTAALTSSTSSSSNTAGIVTQATYSQGFTSLTTANSRFGATTSITPHATPYGTMARAYGWQAGVSAGPGDAMGSAITASRAAFFGGIVASFAHASPACLQERPNYSASSTVTGVTSVFATVGQDGAWHLTTADSSTREAFTLSLGLAGTGDRFAIGSDTAVGVSGMHLTGVAAGHPRFASESTLVSLAPGAYRETAIDSAGASSTAAPTIGQGGSTLSYTHAAAAMEPGPVIITNALTAATTGIKERLFVTYYDPEQ